jgi:hypothetical protein
MLPGFLPPVVGNSVVKELKMLARKDRTPEKFDNRLREPAILFRSSHPSRLAPA